MIAPLKASRRRAGPHQISAMLAVLTVGIRTRAGWPLKLRSTSLRPGFVTVIIEAWTKRSHLNGYGDNKCERAARPMCNHGPKSVRC